jgi:hypothetical protein
MSADVEEGVQHVLLIAYDDEGLLKDIDREKIPRLGDLAPMADTMPMSPQQTLSLTLKEGGIAVERLG